MATLRKAARAANVFVLLTLIRIALLEPAAPARALLVFARRGA
jgi:hypothetical protein